jgi:hypothetical protein
MRDPKAEFEFLDFAPSKPTPGPSTIQKIGPSTLGAWMDCNERATTDAATESERAERDAGSRWLLLTLLGSAVLAVGAGIAVGYALLWVLA